MSMNIHMLQHLKDGVQNFGPLWTHSAFEFESLNAVIKSAVSGKTHVAQKVVLVSCNHTSGVCVCTCELHV